MKFSTIIFILKKGLPQENGLGGLQDRSNCGRRIYGQGDAGEVSSVLRRFLEKIMSAEQIVVLCNKRKQICQSWTNTSLTWILIFRNTKRSGYTVEQSSGDLVKGYRTAPCPQVPSKETMAFCWAASMQQTETRIEERRAEEAKEATDKETIRRLSSPKLDTTVELSTEARPSWVCTTKDRNWETSSLGSVSSWLWKHVIDQYVYN